MHPLLANRTRVLLYFGVWIPIAVSLAYLLHTAAPISWRESAVLSVPLVALFSFVSLASWYLCRILPLGAVPLYSLVLQQLAAAVAAALLWLVAARGLVSALAGFLPGIDRRFASDLPLLFVAGLELYLLAVAVNYVLLSLESSREADQRAQQARTLARDAELRALKAQINPHFLFNSLNSISALATSDGPRAREMCIRLSDFLRRTLTLGDRESIPLADEVALGSMYLSVENIRFGPRLRFEPRIDPRCGACPVPPLILQPLIENAVKHGIAGLIEGGSILLSAECGGGLLRIAVENDFDPDVRASSRAGIGLENVRARVRARYADQAILRAGPSAGRFRVELVLPCDTHRAHPPS
jgi:two-component system sensor histidine kinase AlgZ